MYQHWVAVGVPWWVQCLLALSGIALPLLVMVGWGHEMSSSQ